MSNSSTINSRDVFFARLKAPQTLDVDIGDGQIVKVKKLSQNDVKSMAKSFSKPGTELEGFVYCITQAAVGEDGERLFDDSDAARIASMPFDTVKTIAEAVLDFSGVTKTKQPEPAAE